ncbi:MAG: AraC family transcriptional regulator [Roseimicrobium sp.]
MTRFTRSYFHTERELLRPALYHTVRAGHLLADGQHHVERETLAGHELVYCLRGAGSVRVGGRSHRVKAGALYWVSCWHPHAYWADAADPWELFWMRIDGPGLDALASVLRLHDLPVFPQLDDAAVQACYGEVFAIFEAPSPASPAKMHAVIARLLALLYENRFRDVEVDAVAAVPSALDRPLVRMRQHYADPLRLAELAALAGMSMSHFIRTFKRSMGTSPIDWLRHERINQAKRRLLDTEEPVKEIARQCGYRDPYFFSKDFKKLTGLPPSHYRAQERGKTR